MILNILLLIIEVLLLFLVLFISIKKRIIPSKSTYWFFIPTFLLNFVLYMLGAYSLNDSLTFKQVTECLNSSLKTFAFEINEDFVATNIKEHVMYGIAFYIGYALAVSTSVSFVLSLFIKKLINFVRIKKVSLDDYDILITDETSAIKYKAGYKNTLYWNTNSIKCGDDVYKKMGCISKMFTADNLCKLKSKKKCNLVCYNIDESEKLQVLETFLEYIRTNENSEIKLFIEFDKSINRSLEKRINNRSKYVICFNRYTLLARRFEMDYPISASIDENFLDYSTGALRNNTTLNRVYIGFGNVSQELFRASVMNNQFYTIKGNKVLSKNVNYYGFDKKGLETAQSRNFNHFFDRIKRFKETYKEESEKKYFDLPYDIPGINFTEGCVDSKMVYDSIDEILKKSNSYTEMIVSFGEDFDNLDIAMKLLEKCVEDSIENFKIYVRIKNLSKEISDLVSDKRLVFFGNDESILNHEYIVLEKISVLSAKRNQLYNGTDDDTDHLDKWFNLSLMKKYSNIYSTINIKFKLNLFGLDLAYNESAGITEKDYYKIYSAGQTKFSNNYDDCDISKRQGQSLRDNLAFQEHLRWNASYLMQGYVPMPYTDITYNAEKDSFYKDNDDKRIHSCLTTVEGLDEYHRMLTTLKNPKLVAGTEEYNKMLTSLGTFQYDYQLLDELFPVITALNWTIHRKN